MDEQDGSWRAAGGRSGLFQVQGLLDVPDIGGELLGLAKSDGEGGRVAGGAEAQGRVGVLHQFGEYRGCQQGLALELLAGEVGALLKEVGQRLAEIGVLEPAVEGALGDSGFGGGLGDGGCQGDNGERGLLASCQAKKAVFHVIFCHFLPGERVEVVFGVGAIVGGIKGWPGLAGLLVFGRHWASRGLSGWLDFAPGGDGGGA